MALDCQTLLHQQPHAHAVAMNSGVEENDGELSLYGRGEGCKVLEVEMEVMESKAASSYVREGESLSTEGAAPAGEGGSLPFSKELIRFSLYGKVPAKLKHQLKESLNSRIAEVEQAFKNIPQMLYFSASSVAYNGIGVYAAESLPKDTLLGPYLGKTVRKEQVEPDKNNQWLWEVYEDASLSYFIDARDPKYGNWMNFIQCARHSLEQNLRMAQYNSNLYFVVTTDIRVGDELLVWYDQEQYNIYMGLPTGFREVPPPPLFLEQQTAPGDAAGHTSPGIPPPPLQDHLAQPTYSAYCPRTSAGGGSFSDSASTDDSGLSMDTSGGPTPPLPVTYDPTGTRHSSPHKEGSGLPTEGVCTGYTPQSANSSQLLAGMLQGTAHLPPTSSEEGFSYSGNMEGADHLQQWYNISPLTSTLNTSSDRDKLIAVPNRATASDHSPSAQTPSEAASPWVPVVAPDNSTSWVGGATRAYVESPSSSSSLAGIVPTEGGVAEAGGGTGKKQLLYGLFTRSEDGTRWHCEECKRLFSSQGSLRAHARIHTGERPYQCQYCFRAFCQASTLRSHERLHTGEKPYKCEDCGRAFTQSAGLRSHRKTHRYDS